MYFVPLSQLESVELLIHCLKTAAGQADCSMCPARKVCMQQCLTLASAVEKMVETGTLPQLDDNENGEIISDSSSQVDDDNEPTPPTGGTPKRGGLRVVK